MDFVQITKPTDWLEREDINVIATEALVELSGARGDLFHSQTPGDIVAAARQASNAVFFTCDQVQFLLLELTKAIVIKERYSPKVGTLDPAPQSLTPTAHPLPPVPQSHNWQ